MSTELVLEFVLVEAMKKEGLLEKSVPFSTYLKNKGNTLSLKESSIILNLIEEVEKSATKRILSETKRKLSMLNEAGGAATWVTSKDKELAMKAKMNNRKALLQGAKKKLGDIKSWAGQHKKATAGIAAATLAGMGAAAALRARAKRKKAEQEVA